MSATITLPRNYRRFVIIVINLPGNRQLTTHIVTMAINENDVGSVRSRRRLTLRDKGLGGGGSALLDAERNETHFALPVDQQQNRLSVLVAGRLDALLDIGWTPDLVLRDLNDHIAGFDPFLVRGSILVDTGDDHTIDTIIQGIFTAQLRRELGEAKTSDTIWL